MRQQSSRIEDRLKVSATIFLNSLSFRMHIINWKQNLFNMAICRALKIYKNLHSDILVNFDDPGIFKKSRLVKGFLSQQDFNHSNLLFQNFCLCIKIHQWSLR